MTSEELIQELKLEESQKVGLSEGRKMLHDWQNRLFKVKITDGRIIQGVFLCTDKHSNIILGSCQEFINDSEDKSQEPRTIGLCMVPGNHILSIEIDQPAVA